MNPQLRLYYPVRPFKLNQGWGNNIPCVKNFGESNQHIVSGADNKTCPPGYEKLYPLFGMKGHNGIDLASGIQPVYAAHKGTIVEKQIVPARGLGVAILSDEQYDFGEYGKHYAMTRYWHLHSIDVEVGDKVDVGHKLGLTDSTGYSSGNHLHLELRLVDKDKGGHPTTAPDPKNLTINGSIDPMPYMAGVFADQYAQAITLNQRLISLLQNIINLLKKK